MTVPIDRFFQRGNTFLQSTYPFMCGAMTWVSVPRLVAAVCNAGGFAALAGGNTPPATLVTEVAETRRLTDRAFAVNLVTVSPAFREQLAALPDIRPAYVIFAGTVPREEDVFKAKKTGAKVLCFAPTRPLAERMLQYGADALILEGMEAGGHIGSVTLTVLLQEILFRLPETPIFAAGGIATGCMAAHLLLMGAAGVQFGTAFAVAEESPAHDNFRERIFQAKARDAVVTPQISPELPVVGVRSIRNQGHADFMRLQMNLIQQMEAGEIPRETAQHELEVYWMGALRRAVRDGDVDHGSIMAGQSVGMVTSSRPAAVILQEFVADTITELERVQALYSPKGSALCNG